MPARPAPDQVLGPVPASPGAGGAGGPAGWVRRHPLGAYFVLAYAFSWGYWIPVAAAGGRLSHFPGLLGPLLAAFVVTPVVGGGAGVRDLLHRMGRWRLPLRWCATVLVPLAAAAVALGGTAVAGGALPSLDRLSRMPGLPAVGWFGVFALVVLVNGYGEETGWRGFAWPRLRERHSRRGAAVLLAVPWACWHIPLFWLDTGMRGFPPLVIPGFLAGMVAGALVLGWLYERSGASILIVALWHATLNMASATDGTAGLPAAVTSAAAIGWAVLIARAEARRTASP